MTEIITEWKTGTVAVAAAILLRTAGEFNLMWNASLVWKSIRAEIFLAPMPGLACINTLNQFRFCRWGTCATVSSDIHFDPGGPTPQPFPVAITPPHQFPTTTKHPLRIFTGPTGDLTRKGERGAMWGWFKNIKSNICLGFLRDRSSWPGMIQSRCHSVCSAKWTTSAVLTLVTPWTLLLVAQCAGVTMRHTTRWSQSRQNVKLDFFGWNKTHAVLR